MSLTSSISQVSAWTWILLAVLAVGLRIASLRYQKGLNKYNGPFIASFTDFWRVWRWIWYYDRCTFPDIVHYGKIIRVGPNTLLFNDPDAIKDIYMTHFSKSDFYKVAQGVSKGIAVANIFSTTDRIYHGKLRRSVANAFALSTLVQYEPYVTDTVATFLSVLDRRFANKADPAGLCDLADWCKYFALDVVSALTLGAPYGLLEAGSDHVGIIKARTDFLRYFTIVNNDPWLDKIFKKNPFIMWLGRQGLYNSVTPTVPFALKQIADKARVFKPLDESEKSSKPRVDLITKFLQAKIDNPEVVDDRAVLGLTLSMVNAGSGTVSTTLAAIFYFLLKNPPVLNQLVAEIDRYFPPPTNEQAPINFTEWVVPFADSQKLPFLDAVIKEIFRIWPGLGAQLIERVTPPEGAQILGEFIPGNTVVSCNAWIMHRHKPTFGQDVEEFRPSRWIDADADQQAAMNKALLVFGAGPNTCIGKNIGFLELFKVVPSILRVFTLELAYPERSWKIYNLGDPEPSEFFVRCKPRFQKA